MSDASGSSSAGLVRSEDSCCARPASGARPVCAARGIRAATSSTTACPGCCRLALLNADRAARCSRTPSPRQAHADVADYDCDGATACAVGVRRSRRSARASAISCQPLQARLRSHPEIVALAEQASPELLITVDNGIASVEGVEAARAAESRC